MYRTLIYLEQGQLNNCLNLVKAAEIIGQTKQDYQIYGAGINLTKPVFQMNLDYIINVEAQIQTFDAKHTAQLLASIYQAYKFDFILICATTFGRMLAPRLAMKLRTGLVADVTQLRFDDEQLVMVRPAFSGKMMAAIICDKDPIMMSIRPHVFKDTSSIKRMTKKVNFSLNNKFQSYIRHTSTVPIPTSSDIRQSKILVSCGGGMGNHLEDAKRLADQLQGKLSVSRRPVDARSAHRHIQVGQSGKIVSPSLYIALGISGAVQHVEGIKNADSIISVNTDPFAPLNSLDDMVVVGDAHTFVEKLSNRIKSNKKF